MKPRPPAAPLPPGYVLVPVRTVYLEMHVKPESGPIALPEGCAVELWEKPDTKAYRDLFSAVGGEWGWSGRLIIGEEELETILRAATTEVYRLSCGGQAAGFAELDRRIAGQAEIAYFGLRPGFIGRGLGKFLLDWTIRQAWEGSITRVWLHTCQYDHAGALDVYRKAGFHIYDQQVEMQPYAEGFIRKFPPPGDC